ncbi:MAG TPA: cyclodeaminase/cyclohydrolase family protein [bacterium]|jgi:formiminotetrahydrofolate cyclodeaminase
MINEPVRTFVERLASAEPTPGGGSAAALAGAVAAGLSAMVARLSMGRGADDELLDQSVRTADQAADTLLALVDRDADAFDRVMAAMRMPRDAAPEKAARQAALQEALQNATAVPLTTAEQAMLVLALTPEIARIGNPNTVSDVGVAALVAHAAVRGALLNVAINLKSIKDQEYRTQTAARARELERRADELRTAALDLVEAALA